MKAPNIDVHVHNVEKETCITVTDGEHFFKVYDMNHVEPMLEVFCKMTGADMQKFVATESTDNDLRGVVEILRQGNVRLFRKDEVIPLKLLMLRNDSDGFLVVLEDK